jgi:hypothetical protein
MTTPASTAYEYQVIEIDLDPKADRLPQIVKALNRFGQDGWRLHEFQIDPLRSVNESTLRLLLERVSHDAPSS